MVRSVGAAGALLVVLAGAARAQENNREVDEIVRGAIGTLVALSSGPGLGGATYKVDHDELDLTKFEFVAPLPLGLGRPLDRPVPPPRPSWVVEGDPDPGPFLLEPVVAGRFGYLELTDELRGPTSPELDGARLEFRTLCAGAGVGLRVQPWSWLRLEPRVDLIESRTTSRPDGSPRARTALRTLGDDAFRWRAETLTAVAQLSVSSALPLGPLRLSPRGAFAYYRVETFSSSSSVQDGWGWSTSLSVGLDVDAPLLGLKLGGCPVRVLVGVTCTHYEGDTGRVFDYREIYEFPASLYCETRGRLPYLTRLGVNGEYARGADIEGWTVSVDFDFDF